MEAGREMDRLVAEDVMGWSFDTGIDHPIYGRRGLPPWGGFAPGVQGLSVVPHYSTDDAAALELLLCMQGQGWHWDISDRHSDGAICVRFGRGNYDHHEDEYEVQHWGIAKTIALSVSCAALRARGGVH